MNGEFDVKGRSVTRRAMEEVEPCLEIRLGGPSEGEGDWDIGTSGPVFFPLMHRFDVNDNFYLHNIYLSGVGMGGIRGIDPPPLW